MKKKTRLVPTCRHIVIILALFVTSLTVCVPALAALPPGEAPLHLVPWPETVERNDGALALTDETRIVYAHHKLKPLAGILAQEIELLTGKRLVAGDKAGKGDIVLDVDDALEGESYRLTVADKATVRGANYAAVAAGTATLLQMIDKQGDIAKLPHVRISDAPAYQYRGWMVDVARQAHSIETLEQAIELCRLYKVRYLHLHLNDDQGWTFPSSAYPQLGTENYHGIPRYPLEDLKALVRYADQRGVTIVPELETPGHAGAAMRALPEVFDSLKEDGSSRRINVMNMGNEKLYEVLDVLVGEMAEVFASSPYIHIGCDEAWLALVDKTPEAKEYMQRHDLKDGHEMYYYHIVRMNEMVKARDKQTIVWEGFYDSGSERVQIPKDIIVMPFENSYNPAPNLARHGYSMINTAWSPLYITRWLRFDPAMIYDWNIFKFGQFPHVGYDFISWLTINPTPLVIGAQVCAWEQFERYVIPSARKRVPAMVERIWNPDAGKSYADFERRWRHTNKSLSKLIQPVEITAEGLWRPDPKPNEDNIWHVSHNLFEEQVTVRLSPVRPLRQGEKIHYTLDGTPPSADSPVYSEPLTLGKDDCHEHQVMVKARLFDGDEPVGYTSWAQYEHDWRSELPARFKYTVYDVPRYVTRLSDYMQPIPASALTPAGATNREVGLRGEYFANTNLDGTPAFSRIEKQVDFDWANGGPGSGVGTDNFSVRWQGELTVPKTGDYLLATSNDDGARLYIEGKRIIDDWESHPLQTNSSEIHLEAGRSYDLLLEYYEDMGNASISLSWQPLSSSPADLTVVDAGTTLAAKLGPRIPKPERGYKYAYVFEGRLNVSEEEAGEHEIALRSTSATSQMFIDGELIIDRQETNWDTTHDKVELSAGIHEVKLIFIGSNIRIMQAHLPGQFLELDESP